MPKDVTPPYPHASGRSSLASIRRDFGHLRRMHVGAEMALDPVEDTLSDMDICFASLTLSSPQRKNRKNNQLGAIIFGGRSSPNQDIIAMSEDDAPSEASPMKGIKTALSQSPAGGSSGVPPNSTLDEALKHNASLRRRIRMLERRGSMLKTELRHYKQSFSSLVKEAEGTQNLLKIAEARYQEQEAKIHRVKDDAERYCKLWLAESQSLRDLMSLSDASDPKVATIASSSRERLLAFYAEP